MSLLTVSNSDIEIEEDARELTALFGSSVRFEKLMNPARKSAHELAAKGRKGPTLELISAKLSESAWHSQSCEASLSIYR